jgi:hypothetical protein
MTRRANKQKEKKVEGAGGGMSDFSQIQMTELSD